MCTISEGILFFSLFFAVLSSLTCFGCPFLVNLFCLAALYWFPYPGCRAWPSWMLSSSYPILAVLSWLSCHGCPVLAVLSWLSSPDCPAWLSWIAEFWHFCFCTFFFLSLFLAVFLYLSCFCYPILNFLIWLPCPGCPSLTVLFRLSWSGLVSFRQCWSGCLVLVLFLAVQFWLSFFLHEIPCGKSTKIPRMSDISFKNIPVSHKSVSDFFGLISVVSIWG
jgi:hypothetical protein